MLRRQTSRTTQFCLIARLFGSRPVWGIEPHKATSKSRQLHMLFINPRHAATVTLAKTFFIFTVIWQSFNSNTNSKFNSIRFEIVLTIFSRMPIQHIFSASAPPAAALAPCAARDWAPGLPSLHWEAWRCMRHMHTYVTRRRREASWSPKHFTSLSKLLTSFSKVDRSSY